MLRKVFVFLLFFSISDAITIKGGDLSKKLGLIPGTKASIQWKRIFTNERKLKRYGLDKLSKEEKQLLQEYLINHAADSPRPIVPGL